MQLVPLTLEENTGAGAVLTAKVPLPGQLHLAVSCVPP